jgi:phytoene dehydrogenase-like protein
LEQFGLRYINPKAAYVHGYAPDRALVVSQDLEATARSLGKGGASYADAVGALVPPDWDEVCERLLELPRVLGAPSAVARFGARAMQSIDGFARTHLHSREAQALFAGVGAHAAVPFDQVGTAGIGLTLAIAAHAVGWPIVEGGTQALTDALIAYLESLGGEVITGTRVRSLEDLPACSFLFFDVTPRQFLNIAFDHLPDSYKRWLQQYRYGPAVFKLDWALSSPIPWADPAFASAPTVHLGGKFEDIMASEDLVWRGYLPSRPFVLLVQPTLFDSSRAPEGKHTAWAYCHVPVGKNLDATEVIEAQIERFAPGFGATILHRSSMNAQRLEQLNRNHVDGDINGGSLLFGQLLTRPTFRLIPYKTALPNVYLCSSSTPPGSGVHGMSGYYAAQAALAFGRRKRKALVAH